MFINTINFTKSELEITSGCYRNISSRLISIDGRQRSYAATSLKMKNDSGGSIDFCVFTDDEYDAYVLSGSAQTDLFRIENTDEETINDPRGRLTRVFVQGVNGESYSSGASCIIVQELI